jgi:hypothetical protein
MARQTWREWEGELGPEAEIVYFRDGRTIGETTVLADALRVDGVSVDYGEARQRAEQAVFIPSYYGWAGVDVLYPVQCTDAGETSDGETVSRIRPCVFALVGDYQ